MQGGHKLMFSDNSALRTHCKENWNIDDSNSNDDEKKLGKKIHA